ncbi:MAG: COX15/CtaA family protein [Alphaproteobacteria bacterium]|nr:COX15/CtaA family protein [Alphaproteobacteria bacterium]MBU1513665.1 COX15/CtaA family protein [Alphaproteobacteria bacterium]MBU2094690.1 COX15/CtaA family protein [Alphaproteobacteria bacterium]MBU2150241.1 COX15/CtaA family protein [Alphaproteobacteria bacterium]MBU2309230.1 COX15/CtaA family protein [Alphaproteobacteria bacterium]
MTSFLRSDRSKPVAIWLLVVAVMVLAMVIVGGATRLTDSGLSITQWKPVTGALPPLSDADWQREFALYKQIPQYAQLNAGMTLGAFQAIYWWEWSHRLLGRVLGLVFFIPFVWFAIRRQLPRRLFVRLGGIFILGGLQGAVGWWMVSSGLSERVSVAPERLMVHLGLAFALLGLLLWTAFDAWSGAARQTLPSPWGRRASILIGLIYLQILLGALVAGNDAGLVYNDWPLMNGALVPDDYGGGSLWAILAHHQGAVQLHHRLVAYLLTIVAVGLGVAAWRSSYLARESKLLGVAVAGAVVVQALFGIATLMMRAPVGMSIVHQLMAALVLSLAVAFGWRVRRV